LGFLELILFCTLLNLSFNLNLEEIKSTVK